MLFGDLIGSLGTCDLQSWRRRSTRVVKLHFLVKDSRDSIVVFFTTNYFRARVTKAVLLVEAITSFEWIQIKREDQA